MPVIVEFAPSIVILSDPTVSPVPTQVNAAPLAKVVLAMTISPHWHCTPPPQVTIGVIGLDGLLVAPVPAILVADTVKVYWVPLVSPVATVVVDVVVPEYAAGLETTV